MLYLFLPSIQHVPNHPILGDLITLVRIMSGKHKSLLTDAVYPMRQTQRRARLKVIHSASCQIPSPMAR
jgi:hypothetical protein